MRRVSTAAFILFLCGITYGQSSFQGLTPGVSKKTEVDRTLGNPVRSISATAYAYQPSDGIAGVEVEYDTTLSVVERIEVSFLKPITRSALIQKFELSQALEASKTNSEGKLTEYYGSSFVVLTFASSDQTSGVSRIGYLSRSSFARSSGKSNGDSKSGGVASSGSADGSRSPGPGNVNLPEYMRAPGSNSVGADRDGRASSTTKKSGRGASGSSSESDPGFTRSSSTGGISVVTPSSSGDAGAEVELKPADAQRLVGTYEFAQIFAGSRFAQVEIVNRILRLKGGDGSYTLIPIAKDDFTAGNQGQGYTLSFKASEIPGMKVYFLVTDNKVEKIFVIENQRQPKRFYFGVPK